MSDTGRKTTLVVSLIAAAAAVAVVSGLYWWRMRHARPGAPDLRGVSDILSECQARMRDIRNQLGELSLPDT